MNRANPEHLDIISYRQQHDAELRREVDRCCSGINGLNHTVDRRRINDVFLIIIFSNSSVQYVRGFVQTVTCYYRMNVLHIVVIFLVNNNSKKNHNNNK